MQTQLPTIENSGLRPVFNFESNNPQIDPPDGGGGTGGGGSPTPPPPDDGEEEPIPE